MDNTQLTLEDFRSAAAVVEKMALRTPMLAAPALSQRFGVPIYVKCENLQLTGSYKIRGACYCLNRLLSQDVRGVVAASAGNHAQGVAYAARALGMKAVIFMPLGASLPKYEATRSYGAEVILGGENVSDLIPKAQAYARENNFVFVPPFDHIDIVRGQGTLGLEIVEQVPEVKNIIVPVGGGGLISGVAAAVKMQTGYEDTRIIGVHASGSAHYPAALVADKPVWVDALSHFADGIAISQAGEVNFGLVKQYVDEFTDVNDYEIARAMLSILEESKVVVEPAGAVGVAAVLNEKVTLEGPTVIVLSGGNVDPLILGQIIDRGMSLSWRRLTLRVQLNDVPGQLAKVSKLVAGLQANVVAVKHSRRSYTENVGAISFSQVFMDVELETRGYEHSQEILRVLQEAGFPVEIMNL